MQNKLIIFISIIALVLFQSDLHSKNYEDDNFNQKHLSNYLSALLSYDNDNNEKAIKFFNSSKHLLKTHDQFLKEYVYSLVEDGQVEKAIKQIKYSRNKNSSSFFEAKLMVILDSIKKKNFTKASKQLTQLKKFQNEGTYEYIIYKELLSFNKLFLSKKIPKDNDDFGKLSLINLVFQNCYLNSDDTNYYFKKLINNSEGDYSRYIFFYLANILNEKKFKEAQEISANLDWLSSSLLVLQAKDWVENKKFKNFENHFSCKSETDILGEFFFLISNLYSSQQEFEKSNFYLNLSYFLNSNFYFNLSLVAENNINNENYEKALKIYEKFNNNDQVYKWYKIKKTGEIISKEKNNVESLKYIEKNFKDFKNPNVKILFDLANIYKRFEKYEKSIEYYSIVLLNIEKQSYSYANTLYRRGGSYERINDHEKSDKDLLLSLKINPNEPYVLNYLAYNWLERDFKINEAINMLKIAYEKKNNDPYICLMTQL